jgi:hypothetical protein
MATKNTTADGLLLQDCLDCCHVSKQLFKFYCFADGRKTWKMALSSVILYKFANKNE